MEVKPKVVAAITTAVYAYLQAEQQALLAACAGEERETAPAAPGPTYSPWVMSGRHAAMEMRRYWQMRLVP